MMKSVLLMLAITAACATAQPLLIPASILGGGRDPVVPVPGNVAPYDSNPYNNPHMQCRVVCVQGTRRCHKECPPSLPGTNEVFGPNSAQYQLDAIKDSTTPSFTQPTTDANPAPADTDTTLPRTQQTGPAAPGNSLREPATAVAPPAPNQPEGLARPSTPAPAPAPAGINGRDLIHQQQQQHQQESMVETNTV